MCRISVVKLHDFKNSTSKKVRSRKTSLILTIKYRQGKFNKRDVSNNIILL